jgi:hypothetical protein
MAHKTNFKVESQVPRKYNFGEINFGNHGIKKIESTRNVPCEFGNIIV